MRDLSKSQFERAMKQNGFTKRHLGYWLVDGTGTEVYPGNGGERRRNQLTWAIQTKKEMLDRK